jgi:hypothetical protein
LDTPSLLATTEFEQEIMVHDRAEYMVDGTGERLPSKRIQMQRAMGRGEGQKIFSS